MYDSWTSKIYCNAEKVFNFQSSSQIKGTLPNTTLLKHWRQYKMQSFNSPQKNSDNESHQPSPLEIPKHQHYRSTIKQAYQATGCWVTRDFTPSSCLSSNLCEAPTHPSASEANNSDAMHFGPIIKIHEITAECETNKPTMTRSNNDGQKHSCLFL